VLLPLVNFKSPSVLLEVRAGGLRLHGGEVCLPGGFIQDGESSWECAKREVEEEIGWLADEHQIAGDLGVWWNRKSEVRVTPWVVFNERPFSMNKLKINKDEVDHVFLARLVDLLNPNKRVYKNLHEGWPPVPFFYPDDKHIIWGFTGFVLAAYLDKLEPLLRDGNV
jgi:8-oxo-dGTP pyrophosphatase MutT (NUDIX family)